MNEQEQTSNQELKRKSKDFQKPIESKEHSKESLSFKCEQFFGKNWKYVASFISLALLVCAYEISNISTRMENLEEVVRENNSKVVLTTSDGRAIKVTKEPLKAEYLKQFATSVYVNHFIVSRSQLTNNFEKPNFKDYSEVLDNVPNLKNILLNFIDSKTNQEEGIEIFVRVSYFSLIK